MPEARTGCPCGGGAHPPDSHLWTREQIARATHRSARQVRKDSAELDCPLHGVGLGRGSKWHVYHYEEVRAYQAWVVGRVGA